jgi:hypothetical protein
MKSQPSRGARFAALSTAVCLVAALAVVPSAALAKDKEPKLPIRIRANAMNIGSVNPAGTSRGVARGAASAPRAARVDIRIERWSTDEERMLLMEALMSDGSRTLADALFEQDTVGTVRQVQSLAEQLRFSRHEVHEDGSQTILLGTDRPLAIGEVARSSRSADYNVSLVVLEVDERGRGEGQILLGAEFAWDEEKQQVTIQHFASQPIRLTGVRVQ